MPSFDFWSSLTVAIFAFLATVVGVYYSRNSYILTLRSFEKDKNRTTKAKNYYENYINKPPSNKPSIFLKKIDSDELNESVILPSSFTDYLIKNHPDNFFYLSSKFKNCHKCFNLVGHNDQIKPICKVKHFNLLILFYFFLYVLFATCATILVLSFSKIVESFSVENFWGIFYLTILGILSFITFMFVCLFKTTRLTNTRSLIKELNLERITYKEDLQFLHLKLIGLLNKIKK